MSTISNDRQIYLILAAVFLDMVGVALVVPSLIFRWKEVGISPEGLGAVTSIYSGAQLIGGLAFGYLGDRVLGRKDVLLISFAGSAVSYALVGFADSVALLAVSRVIVGLVKQTMTCANALLTRLSSDATRAQTLGRLSSATTLAFLSGQAIGGELSSRYGRRMPCYFASLLFLVNFALVACFLPHDRPSGGAADGGGGESTGGGGGEPPASPVPADFGGDAPAAPPSWRAKLASRLGGFASAFRGRGGRVLLLRLCYAFLMRSTYSLHALYEQQRWEMDPKTTGYMSSYKQALGLGVDALLVGVLSQRLGEVALIFLALVASAGNAAFEATHGRFWLYAAINLPISAVAGNLNRTSLSALFSKSVPKSDVGAALSVLDVLNSAIGIISPLYGGLLLGRLGVEYQPHISCVHYLTLLLCVSVLVAGEPPREAEEDQEKRENDAKAKKSE